MYLYYFELIVRQAVVELKGPADWALPYWGYDPGGDLASLPEQFRRPADEASNPLYVNKRVRRYNQGAPLPYKPPTSIVSPRIALSKHAFLGATRFGGGDRNITGEPHFWGEAGLLEQTPHNDVHSKLGGWMGDPATAAQDPIFWLHHCNIDRIWAVWNEKEGWGDPADKRWLDHTFEFFDVSKGAIVPKRCGEVRNTATQLHYTYEPSPATATVEAFMLAPPPPPSDATPPPSEPKFIGGAEAEVPLTGAPVEVPVDVSSRGRQEMFEAAAPTGPTRLYLNIEDIEGEENPNTVYGVYLNLPDNPGQADYERHYLGNLSFFGIERASAPAGDAQPHGMRASFEIGPLVHWLEEKTSWDRDRDRLRVSLIPVAEEPVEGIEPESAEVSAHKPVQLGRISVSVDA
jgi:tyrosinase